MARLRVALYEDDSIWRESLSAVLTLDGLEVLFRSGPYPTRGKVNEKVLPTPSSLSTQMDPPWASTIALAI